MYRIDSHQHFWKFDPVKDAWITDEMKAIRKDFLPPVVIPQLKDHGISGCVAVQSVQTEAETSFLLELASAHPEIRGVVGWVNLCADDIDDRLAHYSRFKKLKGFRHVLQGEANRGYMLQPAFKRGIAALKPYNFTYDILLNDDQLPQAEQLVREFPGQPFVIDHLAKPWIRLKEINNWKKNIKAIARYRNVYCKVSGMVTEADHSFWKRNHFTPYLDVVFEAFGPKRVMYGSDWPVCLLAATYSEVFFIMEEYCLRLPANQQSLFWGANAKRFYNLK